MTETRFYRVSFDKELKRQVQQLPGKLRQEAKQRIADLSTDPRPLGAIKLRGYSDIYRTWLTDARYRLIWEVIEQERRVEVYYVGLKPNYEELLGPPPLPSD
ncbi:MAG: hypothetical protein HS114_15535 [Anaerolineales bacterium]|nr:hypothetical protein [Anaerolineales bacterium]